MIQVISTDFYVLLNVLYYYQNKIEISKTNGFVTKLSYF